MNIRYQLEIFRQEVEVTIRALNALEYFLYLLQYERTVLILNENPRFWQQYERALTIQIFIGIRRLFENEKDSFNFQKFINHCIDSVEEFSIGALENRKIEGHQHRPEWLDEFMANVYVPQKSDFLDLARLVKRNSKKINELYKKISTRIFAHALTYDIEESQKMLRQVRLFEIESGLEALWHVYEEIWNLYENGVRPRLEIGNLYKFKPEVQGSLNKQIFGNQTEVPPFFDRHSL